MRTPRHYNNARVRLYDNTASTCVWFDFAAGTCRTVDGPRCARQYYVDASGIDRTCRSRCGKGICIPVSEKAL